MVKNSSDKFRADSFSQLGEDRILAHIFKNRPSGFYIDVGCFHPHKYSNTFLLHQRGWRGINIDISSSTIALFNLERPDDKNIHAAVAEMPGLMEAYFFGDGLSTINTADGTQADLWRKRFGSDYRKEIVPAVKLETIIEQHGSALGINFLNVDVEGLEMSVLRSLNLDRFRPEFIAVEIHAPDLRTALQHETAFFLESHGYRAISLCLITAVFQRIN